MPTLKERKEYIWNPKVQAIHQMRVNIKSLAAEAQFIRKEERKAGPEYRQILALHRRNELRVESRYALLAYAFLRGRTKESAERSGQYISMERLYDKIKRQFRLVTKEDVRAWLENG